MDNLPSNDGGEPDAVANAAFNLMDSVEFDTGNSDARQSKRSKLLSPSFGITPANEGLNIVLKDVLESYGIMVKIFEITNQPIGHLVK